MTREVQRAVKAYRSATGTLDVSQAEEALWLSMLKWRDEEVAKALLQVEGMARRMSAGNVADAIRELNDQRQSFEGAFDGEN